MKKLCNKKIKVKSGQNWSLQYYFIFHGPFIPSNLCMCTFLILDMYLDSTSLKILEHFYHHIRSICPRISIEIQQQNPACVHYPWKKLLYWSCAASMEGCVNGSVIQLVTAFNGYINHKWMRYQLGNPSGYVGWLAQMPVEEYLNDSLEQVECWLNQCQDYWWNHCNVISTEEVILVHNNTELCIVSRY